MVNNPKEYFSVYHKEWYKKNKRKYQNWDYKRRYGVTVEQYDQMLLKQNGLCAICGRVDETGKRLAVDHSHETGKIRGLLCTGCNTGLGKFKDSSQLLNKAATYITCN